jgi:hypothetical protein
MLGCLLVEAVAAVFMGANETVKKFSDERYWNESKVV